MQIACFHPMGVNQAHTTSAAPPAVDYIAEGFKKTDAELDEAISKATQGYTAEGAPLKGDLATFKPHGIKMVRGKCYVLVLRLERDATFSSHAKKGVNLLYTGIDTGIASFNAGVVTHGGPGIIGPGGVATAGCPQADSTVQFAMEANWGSAVDKSHLHDLGQGGYSLQLFSKQTSDSELAHNKQSMQKSLDDSAAFQRQYEAEARARRANKCNRCAQKRLECIADWRRGATRAQCDQEYRSCGMFDCR